MIPHVTVEDARRWTPGLKADAEFIRASLANGKTQNGRILFLAVRLHVEEAAYFRVIGDAVGVRHSLCQALEQFCNLTSAEGVDPEWLRQGMEDAAQVALIMKDDMQVARALACARRLMRADKDVRDYFVAAETSLYQGDRAAATEYSAQAHETKGRYSFGLLDALQAAIDRKSGPFENGMTRALNQFDSDAGSSGYGSTTAVMFLRGAGLLALSRRVNPDLQFPMLRDVRLLPDFV